MNTPNLFYTISEQIASDIKRQILSGELDEDTPLRETVVSKKYNVSRGPVRDAFKILTKEGFLISKPNIGVRVAPHPSNEVFSLIINIRIDLEVFALEKAIKLFNDEDIAYMKALLERIHIACMQDDIYTVETLDIKFHEFIIKKYGDKHLFDLWHSIVNRMMFKYTRLKKLLDTYEEHNAIFNAIINGDTETAKKLLRCNIQ